MEQNTKNQDALRVILGQKANANIQNNAYVILPMHGIGIERLSEMRKVARKKKRITPRITSILA